VCGLATTRRDAMLSVSVRRGERHDREPHYRIGSPFRQRRPPSASRPRRSRSGARSERTPGGRDNIVARHRRGAQRARHSNSGRVRSLVSHASGTGVGAAAFNVTNPNCLCAFILSCNGISSWAQRMVFAPVSSTKTRRMLVGRGNRYSVTWRVRPSARKPTGELLDRRKTSLRDVSSRHTGRS
jgi:hypothetical protein